MRGVTFPNPANDEIYTISTHTPHARRDKVMNDFKTMMMISTHTPHARRDPGIIGDAAGKRDFYSHASCEA